MKNNFSGFIVDGTGVNGCCCKCKERYCLEYSPAELHSEFFNSFTHNTSNRVCPTEAISCAEDSIHIDASKCIGCAVCVSRCPYSAIAYDAGAGKCFVQSNELRIPETPSVQENQITGFQALQTDVEYTRISAPFISASALDIINNTDAPEIIARNLLINLGIITNAYAKGNQHNRIELFAFTNGTYLIGECETSNDSLSVTRKLLDDLSVLVSRYSLNADNIVPLAVLNRLPNKRTDFYEVIEDIRNVLGIQIHTVTYASLFLLNLYRCKLSPDDFKAFTVDRNNTDIREPILNFIPNMDVDSTLWNSDFFAVQK